MLDAKHEFELDMERAGLPPAPPIRQTPVSEAPAMSAPAPLPAAPVPAMAGDPDETKAVNTELSPDEVTRTLNNLADLRDRGAITTEEYEAKKAELLSHGLQRAEPQRPLGAIAHYRELGVGEHAGAPPGGAEHEAHEQKRKPIDPQTPEREDAAQREQSHHEQRCIGRDLSGGHAEAGAYAADAAACEKVFR
jgi:hypothetical protein